MKIYKPIPQPNETIVYRFPKTKTLKRLLKALQQQLLINNVMETEQRKENLVDQDAELFYLWKQAFLSESSLLSILPKN